MNTDAKHPMGVVTRRTGLRPEVIRAWERRHGAIEPSRTPGNRRLYTDADIERLLLIRRALDSGFQIGNVASLENEEIQRLFAGAEVIPFERRVGPEANRIDHHIHECLERIMDLDDEGLERQLEAASVELSRIDLLDRLLVPLMMEVGNACAEGRLRIANEHLASVVARSFLDSMRGAFPTSDTAPAIVVTTPVYQHHELAAMIVAAAARSEGWRATYLGANLPAEEIAASAHKRRARAVALSITWPENDANLDRDLKKLGRVLSNDVVIIAGGRAAMGYRETLNEIGARQPKDLKHLRRLLGEIHSSPSPQTVG